jgi:Dyp-type peroxidase family
MEFAMKDGRESHGSAIGDEEPKLLSKEELADIQGCISSGFGHLSHSAYLFVRVDQAAGAKKWLRHILPDVTNANAGAPEVKPPQTLNIMFTVAGLRSLHFPESGVETFPEEYVQGPARRSAGLGDVGESAPEKWEFGGPTGERIDFCILVSGQTVAALQLHCDRIRAEIELQGGMDIIRGERGSASESGKEPFGFTDGISKLSLKGISKTGVSVGEFILGYPNEYGFLSSGPLLDQVHDPSNILPPVRSPYHIGFHDFGVNGSFLVYRKLEQHVSVFWKFMESESIRHTGRADTRFMVWLAAKMVGRWPSGAPLVLAPERDEPLFSKKDDFLFSELDPCGLRCPLGSHIRRTNPRDHLLPAGSIESIRMSNRHRIIRRGKPYGPELFDLKVLDRLDQPAGLEVLLKLPKAPSTACGLHFLCINASIRNQFEFIQQNWINNANFNSLTMNSDPIAGRNPLSEWNSMLIPRPGLDLRTSPLPTFVTVRAGAYFFIPSIRGLRYLATSN